MSITEQASDISVWWLSGGNSSDSVKPHIKKKTTWVQLTTSAPCYRLPRGLLPLVACWRATSVPSLWCCSWPALPTCPPASLKRQDIMHTSPNTHINKRRERTILKLLHYTDITFHPHCTGGPRGEKYSYASTPEIIKNSFALVLAEFIVCEIPLNLSQKHFYYNYMETDL